MSMDPIIPRHQCQIPLVLSREDDVSGPEYEIRVIQAPKWQPYKSASDEAKERGNASKPVAQVAEDSSSEATTKSLTEFTCFPKLPPELRLMIWKLCHPGPRVVEIKQRQIYQKSQAQRFQYGLLYSPTSTYSPATIPSLLHTCKEAREVALKWYKLSFANWKENAYKFKKDRGPKIFFDNMVDSLYIEKDIAARSTNDIEVVKNLAIDRSRVEWKVVWSPRTIRVRFAPKVFSKEPHIRGGLELFE